MNNDYRYIVSNDIGISSIGTAIFDDEKMQYEELSVRKFDVAKQAKDNRLFRSHRRNLTRKKWRCMQLKNAFINFGLISEEEIEQNGYLSYTTNNSSIEKPKYNTVYHLRKAGLEGKVLSNRELYLALHSICRSRGHFLNEDIDFSNGGIKLEQLKSDFYDLIDEYIDFKDNRDEFEKEVLNDSFNNKLSTDEIKKIEFGKYCYDESVDVLKVVVNLLNDKKDNVTIIDEDFGGLFKDNKANIIDIGKKVDNESGFENLKQKDFFEGLYDLYLCKKVYLICKNYNYICEKHVDSLDEIYNIYKLKVENKELYDKKANEIKSKMNSNKKSESLKVVRNIDNKFPNGWYVKEVHDLLKQQQKYNDKITDEFIEVCSTIISARIPYYIGPLSSNAKNSWVKWANQDKNSSFEYSYEYSKDVVNELETIRAWKKSMISHCTYFPEEEAMPKGSFLYETFAILNEMNVLKAEDKNNNSYYLKKEDKIKIIDELFLKKDEVKFEDVKRLLNLNSFGTAKNSHNAFKNKYTLYKSIADILPEYEIKSVIELFDKNNKKIDMIENIILDVNLYDEKSSKMKNFEGWQYHFSPEKCEKLSKLKSKGFYSLSKKLIFEQPFNEKGQTMFDILFEDNENYSNEQESIIFNAVDKNGEKIDLLSNKYMHKIQKGKPLSIDLLIEEGKNTLPISRAVIRSLNECFKMYEEIIKVYGIPKKVILETARDLKDSSRKGEVPKKHFKKLSENYTYLVKQLKENKKIHHLRKSDLADWDKLEEYVTKNIKKIDLYISQCGQDIITGDRIKIDELTNYEIDHILPRGFGDNSMDNLILIHKNTNAIKNDRVPLEAIESADGMINADGDPIVTSDYIGRCKELFELKLISEKKYNQLTLSKSEVNGFINRNLVDTRYIIREFMAILNAYNKVNGYNTKVVALKSAFTKMYSDALDIKKNRDYGDQHHAYDAASLIIADKILNTYYDYEKNDFGEYRFYVQKMKEGVRGQRAIRNFIQYVYKYKFKQNYDDNDSIVSKLKEIKPLYSLKVEKNYTDQIFKATILPQEKEDDPKKETQNILDLFGINDKEKKFTGVNCVAVDFYKYKDKKGNRKHAAIQIPYFMVNAEGNIDKIKYIKLIEEWYKIPELLDKDKRVKEECFRFRAFNNDLIYDTVNNNLLSFVCGSIANKKLEFRNIDIFNYNSIYLTGNKIREIANKKYNSDRKNKDFFENSKDKEKGKLVEDLVEECCLANLIKFPSDEYKKSVVEKLMGSKTLFEFSNDLAHMGMSAMWTDVPNKIDGRGTKTVQGKIDNSPLLKQMDKVYKNKITNDSEYVKVKSSILGIRWENSRMDDDMIKKIRIFGPKIAPQMFKLIKKEKFYWNISRKMIE